MQVNKIGHQPNFKARILDNQAAREFSYNEIIEGRDEELIKTLNDLSKHHANVVLEMSKINGYSGKGYRVTNLYNGNYVDYLHLTNEKLEKLNDIKSFNYKTLFVGDKKITPKKSEMLTNKIADTYFVNSVPDYTLGHKVDTSY